MNQTLTNKTQSNKGIFKFLFLTLFIVMTVANSFAQFSGGDGSASNPFRVTTAAQLDSVRNYLDTNFILVNDIDLGIAPYDTGNGWLPIGDNSSPFNGSFNGAGHCISNLNINRPSEDSLGLFGVTLGAVIDSLAVLNCNIIGKGYVGGLVGYNYTSSLSNCYATGTVSGNGSTGGLVGLNLKSTISNCYATVAVSGTAACGCLAGYNFGYSTISNCYATGKVTGTINTGGLTGINQLSTISGCYTSGQVLSSNSNVGGLAGYTYSSTIENCYATGPVSGDQKIGGLVGYNRGSSAISYCYASGQVFGNSNTGGLVGYNESSTITNAYFNTETSGQDTVGIGYDDNSQTVTVLTTEQMKQDSSFKGFSYSTVWAIRADSTYPSLLEVDNAPFAFVDTVSGVGTSVALSKFFTNDFDFETIQEALIVTVDSISSGILGNNAVYLPDTVESGDEYIAYYRIGEVRANDTLWGNRARSVLIATTNTAPQILPDTVTIDEDTAFSDYINNLVTDAENDVVVLSIVDSASNGTTIITNDSVIYIPNLDFIGTDSLQLKASDGLLETQKWLYFIITPVNDAPILLSVISTSTNEDVAITLSMDDVTASDAEGDALSIIVYSGNHYTVTDSTVTPDANYNGTLTVPIAVTDGMDTSATMNMSITINPVQDAPVLTAVNTASTFRDVPITLSMDNVTASDVDGDALILVVYAGDNYSANGATITPATGFIGTLTVPVAVTDAIDTSNSMDISITVGETGINNALANNIRIYPNPANDKVTIQGIKEITELKIMNTNGQIVFSRNITASEAIDVSALPKGTYFVVLKDYGIQEKLFIY